MPEATSGSSIASGHAPPRISVIISTFDRPDALRLVLEGYTRSTYRDFEVVVADDGSASETGAIVDSVARKFPFPLARVWQPHEGFRLAAARNLAARSARGRILVFTDGDCIPFSDALEAHAARCAPGRAQTGSRCLLSEEETDRLLRSLTLPSGLEAVARRREAPRLRRERWKNRFYAVTRLKPRPKLLTANAAVHRDDFERVNGFDERFVGWGYEDEDLARRLRRAGVKVLDAARESLVLHLFHPVDESHRPDARAGANYRYFKSGSFLTRPLKGLRTRRVEDLAVEILGAAPEPLLLAFVPAPKGQLAASERPTNRPEVSVVFGVRGVSGPRPRGEVVIRVPGDSPVTSPEALYRLVCRRI